jgi:hypothetical protein
MELQKLLRKNVHFYKGHLNVMPPMIKYPVIEIPHKSKPSEFFVMTVPSTMPETEQMTSKMGGLLENDEILADNGIYCYVICQLTQTKEDTLNVSNEIKFVAKKVNTIQEVHTAHGYILRDLKQIVKAETGKDPAVIVLYAGELRIKTTKRKNKKVSYNFMSGTYMFTDADRTDILPEASKDAIKITSLIIQSKLGPVLLVYDPSNETYILPEEPSLRMTKDRLISYFAVPGVVVRRFTTYDEAVSYYAQLSDWNKNLQNAEARLVETINQLERTKKYYKTQEEFDAELEIRTRQHKKNIDRIKAEQNRVGIPILNPDELGVGIKRKKTMKRNKMNKKIMTRNKN